MSNYFYVMFGSTAGMIGFGAILDEFLGIPLVFAILFGVGWYFFSRNRLKKIYA